VRNGLLDNDCLNSSDAAPLCNMTFLYEAWCLLYDERLRAKVLIVGVMRFAS
jgi:hypothetical protein